MEGWPRLNVAPETSCWPLPLWLHEAFLKIRSPNWNEEGRCCAVQSLEFVSKALFGTITPRVMSFPQPMTAERRTYPSVQPNQCIGCQCCKKMSPLNNHEIKRKKRKWASNFFLASSQIEEVFVHLHLRKQRLSKTCNMHVRTVSVSFFWPRTRIC